MNFFYNLEACSDIIRILIKIQQKSEIGVKHRVEVIMPFLEVMWNMDQNSLVSRGWPCGDSYTYSSQLTKRAGSISRQMLK